MAIELTQQNKQTTALVVHDEMTVYTVAAHKRQLTAYLYSTEELQLDLSGVGEIDGAGIQLLMFLKQEAHSRNIALSLTRHSQAVVEALELLNLSKHFGDPIVISANWKA